MANLKDKIEYDIKYHTLSGHNRITVNMYIYDEFLGWVRFLDVSKYNSKVLVLLKTAGEIDKAPYFGFTKHDLMWFAKEYMKSLGYNVIYI